MCINSASYTLTFYLRFSTGPRMGSRKKSNNTSAHKSSGSTSSKQLHPPTSYGWNWWLLEELSRKWWKRPNYLYWYYRFPSLRVAGNQFYRSLPTSKFILQNIYFFKFHKVLNIINFCLIELFYLLLFVCLLYQKFTPNSHR